MTIIELLNQLAEKAPDSCKKAKFNRYQMGKYQFGINPNDSLHALIENSGSIVSGRPALAWLADAIMAECEKRGWYWELFSNGVAIIWEKDFQRYYESSERLLAAFLATIEGER